MPFVRFPVGGVPRVPPTCLTTRAFGASASAYKKPQKPPGPRNMRRTPPPLPYVGSARRAPGSRQPQKSSDQPQRPGGRARPRRSRVEVVSAALRAGASNSESSLLAPVHIPDDPHSVLKPDHPCTSILSNSSIVVQRQLEMMNVFLGFEQANRYVIMDGQGNTIGFLAEQENGIGGSMARQMFKTHRSFTTHVFDKSEREVLRFHRPFSWVNSKIRIYDCVNGVDPQYTTTDALQNTSISDSPAQISPLSLSAMRVIGEAQQQWAPLRRKYNLFLARSPPSPDSGDTPLLSSGDLPLSSSKSLQVVDPDESTAAQPASFVQFARVDEPFLSWDFALRADDGRLLGTVNRNFGGFAREVFTDTGVYALRMDAAALQAQEGERPELKGEDSSPGMTLDQRAVMLAAAVSVDFDYFSRHSHVGGGLPLPIWLPGGGGGGVAGAEVEAGAGGGAVAGGVEDASPVASDAWMGEAGQGAGSAGRQGEQVWGETQNPWGSGGGSQSGGGGGGGGSSEGGDAGSWIEEFFG